MATINFPANNNRNMEEARAMLQSMGFEARQIELALQHNDTVDGAVGWLFENPPSPTTVPDAPPPAPTTIIDSPQQVRETPSADSPSSTLSNSSSGQLANDPSIYEELKVALLINMDLNMSAGKIATQCAHAAFGLYRTAMAQNPTMVAAWETMGEKTVTLQCDSDALFGFLSMKAAEEDVPTFALSDVGVTEVSFGGRTVLAVGPGPASKVDMVTGDLPRY